MVNDEEQSAIFGASISKKMYTKGRKNTDNLGLKQQYFFCMCLSVGFGLSNSLARFVGLAVLFCPFLGNLGPQRIMGHPSPFAREVASFGNGCLLS